MIELIKRYLKAEVMENGLLVKTEEGSPQGGLLSPLLANIYLNEYDQEMERRDVPVMPQWQAYRNGNSQKGYWAIAGSGILTKTITNKRLAEAGYFEIQNYYESLHLCD